TPMRVTARLWVPVFVALAIIAMIGGVFLWQIDNSVAIIEHTAHTITETGRSWLRPIRPSTSNGTQNEAQALALLRQGELKLAQGELEQAEMLLKQSVDAGGGV